MANFPTFTDMTEDSSKYVVEYEDNTIKSSTDGGYVFTRPRFTRKPSRIISTGFSSLNHANFTTLKNFYLTHQTHSAFNYTDPTTQEVIVVRFEEPFKAKRVGVGTVNLWNIDIKLREV